MKPSASAIVVLMSLVLVQSALAESPVSAQREILDQALIEYAQALQEPDRDVRLAVFARAEYGFASVIEGGAENAAVYTNLEPIVAHPPRTCAEGLPCGPRPPRPPLRAETPVGAELRGAATNNPPG